MEFEPFRQVGNLTESHCKGMKKIDLIKIGPLIFGVGMSAKGEPCDICIWTPLGVARSLIASVRAGFDLWRKMR